MTDNIFFDTAKLKYRGENAIIGKTVRVRYPELVSIGANSVIDDFTYISTALEIASFVHISAGCNIIGGPRSRAVLSQYSTLAPNVTLAAASDDYIGGIATPLIPQEFKGDVVYGEIILGRHCIIGAGSVVLPNVRLADGAAVGALSLVKSDLAAWTLYAGVPARKLRMRDQRKILHLESELLASE